MKSSVLCENRTHDLHIESRDICSVYCANEALTRTSGNKYIVKHFSIFFFFFGPRVHQTQKLYQFINTGSSLLLPKRKYETNSATYFSAYNIYIYIYKA